MKRNSDSTIRTDESVPNPYTDVTVPHLSTITVSYAGATGPNNTVWHNATVTRERREQLNGHRSLAVWFTGLSGSGKSTIAHSVEENLHRMGCRTYVLDGDNVRLSLIHI